MLFNHSQHCEIILASVDINNVNTNNVDISVTKEVETNCQPKHHSEDLYQIQYMIFLTRMVHVISINLTNIISNEADTYY